MIAVLRPLCLAAALGLAAPLIDIAPAGAQGLFAPVATVENRVVTAFERDQRLRMLQIFGAPNPTPAEARDTLIDERLQLIEHDRLGLTVTPQELQDGMTEFAGRADLTLDEFREVLRDGGVEIQAFEDFVRAGIAWREIVSQRFGGGQTQIADDVVERAADTPPAPELRLLLNEIILPANTPQARAQTAQLVDRIAAIRSAAAFESAARSYSVSPSRDRGGRIDWLPAANLPGPLAQAILDLEPGEVAGPVQLPNAVAFFQLRDVDEIPGTGQVEALDYAALYLAGGRTPETLAEAAQIAARVDTCDDLYGIAQGRPADRLQRDTLPPDQIPADVALELAKLDEDEISTALTRANGQTLVFLMLCDRSYRPIDEDPPNLEALRRSLISQRVENRANAYLAELRANATITTPGG